MVDPPRSLRPFLRFARLPEQALAAVRRALEDDAEFRARVASATDERVAGRAGWLFVHRPDGWEAELVAIAEEARAQAASDRDEREERTARRRLSHAEAATERAEAAAARARAEAERAVGELAAERRERRAAQEEAARLGRRVASLEAERDSAHRRAAEAAAEAQRLRETVEALQAEARARAEGVAGGPGDAPIDAPAAPAAPVAPAGMQVAEPGPDLDAVARAVTAAAAAARSLALALGDVADELAPPPAADVVADPGATAPEPPQASVGRRRPPASRRRPADLPPAVFDDTAEAAAHLVRLPGAIVLVDGYNAAKALWPDEAPLELRERLVDALSELHARTGADVHVVFDGADLGAHAPQPRPAGRRAVRVSFSPPDVEADDVILDLVDASPLERPVVVASSDRRVRDGARQRGASAISSAQLAGALGRS